MASSLLRPVGILLLLVGASCGSSSQSDVPVPSAVSPKVGYSTVSTPVEISGTRFLAKATQSALETRHRAWLGEVELGDVTWVSTEKLTATVPPGLPVGAQTLTVENALGERGTLASAFTVLAAPAFSATVQAPPSVSVGQTFAVTLTLANNGGAEVSGITLGQPVLAPSGLAVLVPLGGPVPPTPETMAVGAQQSFTWTYRAAAAGTLSVTFGATTGTDAILKAPVTATPPAPAQVSVQRPAAISVIGLLVPPSVAVGADFPVQMTVQNAGDAGANAVTPATPAVVAGSGGAAALKAGTGASPASAVIPGGQFATFTWTFTATRTGSFQLSGGASATDANSGSAITAAAAASNASLAGNVAILATVKSAPASVKVGQSFRVIVTFSNPGSANVGLFTVSTPSPAPVSGPTVLPPATLAAGQAVDVTWNFRASATGGLTIAFGATGIDSSTGLGVAGTTTATTNVTP